MADILHAVGIGSSTESLYQALTETQGLTAWWSQHSSAEPVEGAQVNVSFYNGAVAFAFRITELVPNEKIVWNVEGGPPDWVDTSITWTISEPEGQTMIHLAHRGFASMEGNFAGVNYNWGWYITSLKFYLEKGEGMPHTDADLP